ncbi:MAG: hypothetical protein AAFU85_28375 [Planctomycetota bacterium]
MSESASQKRTFVVAFTCIAPLAVLVIAVSLSGRSSPPLSAAESRLVGSWSEAGKSEALSFRGDRTFRSRDGQFAGDWSISDGTLSLRYWQNDHQPSSLRERMGILFRRLNASEDQWKIEMDSGEDQISITLAGQKTVLMRQRDDELE